MSGSSDCQIVVWPKCNFYDDPQKTESFESRQTIAQSRTLRRDETNYLN
jgi:hypothetical protein